MRIIVLIKQIPNLADSYVSKSKQAVVFNSPQILNPVDENAIEFALKVKEEKAATVIAMGLGSEDLEMKLKDALAMGCDEAHHIADKIFEGADSAQAALILSRAIKKQGGFDSIVAGAGSITGNGGQVGIRVAEILNFDGLVVVAKDSNKPRIPTAMGIAKAAHKKLVHFSASDLGISQDELEKARAFDMAREYLP